MLQPINKKLTIDYQPNKYLIIEYGDYEKQKKYAWLLSFEYLLPLILILLFTYLGTFVNAIFIIIGIVLYLIYSLYDFYIISPYFLSLRVYYKLKVTPLKIKAKYLSETDGYDIINKIMVEVEGLEKDNLFGFWINEEFGFRFDDELEEPKKQVVLNALVELLHLEFMETKTEQSGKNSWKKLIYQSKKEL